MGYYICHACGKGLCHHSVNCYGIADINELICEDCVADYLCALEERDGEASAWNGDEFPTFDRELFENFQERQRREAWDRQVAWMSRGNE